MRVRINTEQKFVWRLLLEEKVVNWTNYDLTLEMIDEPVYINKSNRLSEKEITGLTIVQFFFGQFFKNVSQRSFGIA